MRLKLKYGAVCLALVLVGLWLGLKLSHTAVVIFDGRQIRGEFIKQLAMHQASSKEVEIAHHSFQIRLTQVLNTYAKKHRVLIVDKNVVAAGGDDVTEAIVYLLGTASKGAS